MDNRILIREAVQARDGSSLTICGWVHSLRLQKKMQFAVVRDHTGVMQVVCERSPENHKLNIILDQLTPESAVVVSGVVVHNSNVRLHGVELVVTDLVIVSLAETPLPLGPNSTQEARLNNRFLDLRSVRNNLIFRVQTLAEQAMRTYWTENGFIEIHSPKLMGGASESGAELFTLEYFGQQASLAQSPQLYKQLAMAAGFDRIFEIGPVFRADPSFTSRHETEFISVDVEISWIETHEDLMRLQEEWLLHVISTIKHTYGSEIQEVFGLDINVPTIPFPRCSMREAYDILAQRSYEVSRVEKGDLDPGGERELAAYIKEKFDHDFVFVTDYPATARPFYHMRHPENPALTRSFDLLWKGLEVTTGAQREHRYAQLMTQIHEKGVDSASISFYLDCFRYGCPPHGGYGFGLARMLAVLLEQDNIREVIFHSRTPNRLVP